MGDVLAIDPKKIRRWYRDVLSGYKQEGLTSIHVNDVVIKTPIEGEKRIILVPFCISENMGSDMCIDEKMIGEEFYTIISNRKTGKLAFMANTTNSKDLLLASKPLKAQLKQVQIINRDLAGNYRKFCNLAMPLAEQTGDKFHVIKLLLDASQSVRIKQKSEMLSDKRQAYNDFKEEEKQRKIECKRLKHAYIKRKYNYTEKMLSNLESASEALTRSRYMLYKYPYQWTDKQASRAHALFEEFPEIEQAYNLSIQFRDWYSRKNISKSKHDIERELFQWYQDVETSGLKELMNFSSTVERNEDCILNFFYQGGATNAMAENRNGKIKKFINSNQGIRDRDFFFFRLKVYFT